MQRLIGILTLLAFAGCGDAMVELHEPVDPADAPGTPPPGIEAQRVDFEVSDIVLPSAGPIQTLSNTGPQIVFVNFDGPTIDDCANCSDAVANQSMVIGRIFNRTTLDFAPFTSAPKQQTILANLRAFYADYDVRFVTSRPSAGPYTMVVISPTPGPHKGVAPLNCGNSNPSDIAFVYDIAANSADAISRFAAHELGHSFGLAHVTGTSEVMQWASAGRGFGTSRYDDSHPSGKCFDGATQDARALLIQNIGLAGDTDGDGRLDRDDNCPLLHNPQQHDFDANGVGDACQTWDGTFADDDGSIHEASIEFIAALGVTHGCRTDILPMYCPRDSVTRGQMAAFLTRALALPPSSTNHFDDDDGSIFEGAINSLAEARITMGCGDRRFCPGDQVTRGQMAAFLTRAFGYPPSSTNWFDDDDGTFYEASANALAEAGITVGCGARRYCGAEPVTREQMATFLTRALR